MFRFSHILGLILISLSLTVRAEEKKTLATYPSCFEYIVDGKVSKAKPHGSATFYKIIQNNDKTPTLKVVNSAPVYDPSCLNSCTLRVVSENAVFEPYKCWSSSVGNIQVTGFDIQLITQLVAGSRYEFLELVEIPWTTLVGPKKKGLSKICETVIGKMKSEIENDHTLTTVYQGCHTAGEVGYQLSFLSYLNRDLGDVALAGMSINKERLATSPIVGPIYKAGKYFVAAKDNTSVQSSVAKLLKIPDLAENDLCQRYQALRGFSVVESNNIRGDFLKDLDSRCKGLMQVFEIGISINDNVDAESQTEGEIKAIRTENLKNIKTKYNQFVAKFNRNHFILIVIEDYPMIEEFIDSGLKKSDIFDNQIDLVMIDSGAAHPLTKKDILGKKIEIVTQDLSNDDQIGSRFGLGDGIGVNRTNRQLKTMLEDRLKQIVNDGTLDQMVERWFNDSNFADHNCIENVSACL